MTWFERDENEWYTWRIEIEAPWVAKLLGDGWTLTEVIERWGYWPERHDHSGPITCGCARNFNPAQKAEMMTRQNGICPACDKPLFERCPTCQLNGVEGDHVIPWIEGGPTKTWNGRALHVHCHRHRRPS
jgi:hypothetical protein